MVYYYLLPHITLTSSSSLLLLLLLHCCYRYCHFFHYHSYYCHYHSSYHLIAATFNTAGYTDIATLEDAYALLSPILGTTAASTIFAVALLCSGQVNGPLTYSNYAHSPLPLLLDYPPPPWTTLLVVHPPSNNHLCRGATVLGTGGRTPYLL